MKMLPILLMALASPALAQTQTEMTRQAGRSFAEADAAMNGAYRAAMARMKAMDGYHAPNARNRPGYRNALLASQRAWLGFRDAECLVEGYQYRGGSAEPMVVGQCKARLTAQRTQQLKAMQRK